MDPELVGRDQVSPDQVFMSIFIIYGDEKTLEILAGLIAGDRKQTRYWLVLVFLNIDTEQRGYYKPQSMLLRNTLLWEKYSEEGFNQDVLDSLLLHSRPSPETMAELLDAGANINSVDEISGFSILAKTVYDTDPNSPPGCEPISHLQDSIKRINVLLRHAGASVLSGACGESLSRHLRNSADCVCKLKFKADPPWHTHPKAFIEEIHSISNELGILADRLEELEIQESAALGIPVPPPPPPPGSYTSNLSRPSFIPTL